MTGCPENDLQDAALSTINEIRARVGAAALDGLPKGDKTALGCCLSMALPFGAHCFKDQIHTKPADAKVLREVFGEPAAHPPFAVRLPHHLAAFQAAYIAGDFPWLLRG